MSIWESRAQLTVQAAYCAHASNVIHCTLTHDELAHVPLSLNHRESNDQTSDEEAEGDDCVLSQVEEILPRIESTGKSANVFRV